MADWLAILGLDGGEFVEVAIGESGLPHLLN
jgi:hypothetical protein